MEDLCRPRIFLIFVCIIFDTFFDVVFFRLMAILAHFCDLLGHPFLVIFRYLGDLFVDVVLYTSWISFLIRFPIPSNVAKCGFTVVKPYSVKKRTCTKHVDFGTDFGANLFPFSDQVRKFLFLKNLNFHGFFICDF